MGMPWRAIAAATASLLPTCPTAKIRPPPLGASRQQALDLVGVEVGDQRASALPAAATAGASARRGSGRSRGRRAAPSARTRGWSGGSPRTCPKLRFDQRRLVGQAR